MTGEDRNFTVRKIRSRYIAEEDTRIDGLKALDRRVKRPANVFAYIFGSVSALVMGCGMSLVMTDISATLNIASPMICGIAIGVVGMAGVIVNYPIYRSILSSRRRKYADRIIALSDEIMKD